MDTITINATPPAPPRAWFGGESNNNKTTETDMHSYKIIVAYRQLEGKEEYRTFSMAGDSFSEIYGIIEVQVVPGRRVVAVVRERMVTL